jgi:hypothetical protein
MCGILATLANLTYGLQLWDSITVAGAFLKSKSANDRQCMSLHLGGK